ncbi:phage holin family protein [Metabacillus sp. GX 13764]|uniref:phage holin family protein n=1 Tax=Metabacillus kandeliae TaxID=2900151 RepID=UPI001E657615|nr:phage holin family protein [Metabacillus kandeliae]MCD7035893.1 phage holin family protein [Metabacillus kandeliae]
MIRWLVSILVNALILIVVAGFFKDTIYLSGIPAAILASFILSIVNLFVKPILILLTLPVTVLTLGLFLFVINGISLWITQGIMGDSFNINGFGAAILASVVISLLHLLIQKGIMDPLQERRQR